MNIPKANKMIDDITSQVKIMNPTQIQDLEQIVQTPQKKTGFWKKVGVGALGILMGTTVVNNVYGQSAVGVNNNKPETIIINGTTGIVNGKPTYIVPEGGSVAVSLDGKSVIPIYNSQQPNYSKDEEKTYASEIDRLNAAIKQNPTNASLYFAKGDELYRKKSPPEQIINVFEKGLQYAKGDEKIKIHYFLGCEYNTLGNNRKRQNKPQEAISNYKKALIHHQYVKKLDPDYKSIDWSIEQLTKKSKGKF